MVLTDIIPLLSYDYAMENENKFLLLQTEQHKKSVGTELYGRNL